MNYKTRRFKKRRKKKERTCGSSSMAERRAERRSKEGRGSGDCWEAEAPMDSNCATRTPNRERGTFSLTRFFDILSFFLKDQELEGLYLRKQTRCCRCFNSSKERILHRLERVRVGFHWKGSVFISQRLCPILFLCLSS